MLYEINYSALREIFICTLNIKSIEVIDCYVVYRFVMCFDGMLLWNTSLYNNAVNLLDYYENCIAPLCYRCCSLNFLSVHSRDGFHCSNIIGAREQTIQKSRSHLLIFSTVIHRLHSHS